MAGAAKTAAKTAASFEAATEMNGSSMAAERGLYVGGLVVEAVVGGTSGSPYRVRALSGGPPGLRFCVQCVRLRQSEACSYVLYVCEMSHVRLYVMQSRNAPFLLPPVPATRQPHL